MGQRFESQPNAIEYPSTYIVLRAHIIICNCQRSERGAALEICETPRCTAIEML